MRRHYGPVSGRGLDRLPSAARGAPPTGAFLGSVLDDSSDLPPHSLSARYTLPAAFEEIAFRGVVLTMFLVHHSRRRAILVSAAAFSVIHLLTLAGGRPPLWVAGQLAWAFCMGIFHGTLCVRTASLLPAMLVHCLGNLFSGSLTGGMQSRAPVGTQVFYDLILSLGVVPVTLIVLWVRFFVRRWPVPGP
ncbi:MAG: CPBP family intramembrane metalloprotease [Candidatus Eisenbacteria bacterium]|nr:CPBP family intramembrane metalloprotease [Candidatus Eisenbacteria bacterium]